MDEAAAAALNTKAFRVFDKKEDCVKRFISGTAALCVLFFSGICAAADTDIYKNYCNFEGMLSWQGDPELRGRVKSVRIIQYGAIKNLDGQWIKKDADKPIFQAELNFDGDGRIAKALRMPRGASSNMDVTEYNKDGTLMHNSKEGKNSTSGYVRTYDEAGRVIRLDLYSGGEHKRTEEQYVYNAAGQLQTKLNSLGQLSTFTYDDRGNVLRESISPVNTPDTPFLVKATTYDAQNRTLVSSLHDTMHNTRWEERWTYDSQDRETKRQRLMFSPKEQFLSEQVTEYDARGDRVLVAFVDGKWSTRNSYTRDQNGAVTEIMRQMRDFDGKDKTERLRFINDAQGNWTRGGVESEERPCIIERVLGYYL